MAISKKKTTKKKVTKKAAAKKTETKEEPIVRGIPFKKGNKFGKGRPKKTAEDKKLSKLTRTKFNEVVHRYLDFDKAALKKVVTDPKTPALELMIISVMNKAITSGDERKMNWFLEQLFGKLVDKSQVEVSGDGHEEVMRLIRERLQKNGV